MCAACCMPCRCMLSTGIEIEPMQLRLRHLEPAANSAWHLRHVDVCMYPCVHVSPVVHAARTHTMRHSTQPTRSGLCDPACAGTLTAAGMQRNTCRHSARAHITLVTHHRKALTDDGDRQGDCEPGEPGGWLPFHGHALDGKDVLRADG